MRVERNIKGLMATIDELLKLLAVGQDGALLFSQQMRLGWTDGAMPMPGDSIVRRWIWYGPTALSFAQLEGWIQAALVDARVQASPDAVLRDLEKGMWMYVKRDGVSVAPTDRVWERSL